MFLCQVLRRQSRYSTHKAYSMQLLWLMLSDIHHRFSVRSYRKKESLKWKLLFCFFSERENYRRHRQSLNLDIKMKRIKTKVIISWKYFIEKLMYIICKFKCVFNVLLTKCIVNEEEKNWQQSKINTSITNKVKRSKNFRY